MLNFAYTHFFFNVVVRTAYFCGTVAAHGHIAQSTDDTCVNMEQWWNDTDGKTKGLGEKPVPLSLYPLKNLHGLYREQTWVSVVKCQLLTPSGMGWPHMHIYHTLYRYTLVTKFNF
jgi:hypothetical protein